MTLRKQSQPQPPGVAPASSPPLQLPEWPPDQDRIQHSVLACLADREWASYDGPTCDRLRASLAQDSGVRHVRLVSSGTMAIELALRGCRIGPGDEVIQSAFDYPGNFRCVEATGATSVLIDLAAQRWTVDVEAIEAALTPRTRAVIVSHLYGSMADASAVRRLADERGIFFIEDACQTPGARIQGRAAGTWGHVGALSFGGSKLLTCGNGGAVLTDDPRIEGRIRLYAERPGNAFAMSQLQAAALLPQVESLSHWTKHRRRAVEALRSAVAEAVDARCLAIGGRREAAAELAEETADWRWGRREPQDVENAYYKLAWFAPDAAARDRQIDRGRQLGLPLGAGFAAFSRPVANRRRPAGPLPHAEHAAATTVLLDHRGLAGDEAWLTMLAARLAQLQGPDK